MRYVLSSLILLFALTNLGVSACSDNGNEEYEGDEAGECNDGADNDRDGLFDCDDSGCATSPACSCIDECTPEGASECSGDVARNCGLNADGCLEWTEQNCSDGGMYCSDGACVSQTGTCSVTGNLCTASDDCPMEEVTGFCIVRDDAVGQWHCGYDTRIDTGSTVSCEGETVGRCETLADCPSGSMSCASYNTNWCGTAADGICVVYDPGAKPPCSVDTECSYTPTSNDCVICGDGVTDEPFEECDDDNTTDGDGCSSSCLFEGTCMRDTTPAPDCGCATDGDCTGCGICVADGDCTCDLP